MSISDNSTENSDVTPRPARGRLATFHSQEEIDTFRVRGARLEDLYVPQESSQRAFIAIPPAMQIQDSSPQNQSIICCVRRAFACLVYCCSSNARILPEG